MVNLKKLSKTISLVLKHKPGSFGLIRDKEGWVDVNQLLFQIRKRNPSFMLAQISDIEKILETSEKKRFELKKGKIRAYYGHSSSQSVEKQREVPPDVLYQGTTPEALESIFREGLKPMTRQFVHMSGELKTAKITALRRTKTPVYIEIDAKKAHEDGIHFFLGNQDVWLAKSIPPEYLSQKDI